MPGAKLYFYVSGTSTAATTYQNATVTTAHANPVVADVGGLFPAIWLSDNVAYDVTLKDSTGATQWSVTAVAGTSQASLVLTSAATGEPYTSTFVRFNEPAGTLKGQVGFTSAADNRFTITSREDAPINLLTGTPGDATSSILRAAVYGDADQSWINIYSGTTTGGAELRFYDIDATTVIGKIGHTSVSDDDLDILSLVSGADINLATTGTSEINLAPGGTIEAVVSATGVHIGASTAAPVIASGTGSPEGVVAAAVGSVYLRTNGTAAAGDVKYLKTSGAATNAGWVQDCSGGGATTASADPLTLPPTGVLHTISGTTNIASITASWAGRIAVLKFEGILTVTDGSNLVMAGNFVTTANDTLTLISDGTNWVEMARSVN